MGDTSWLSIFALVLSVGLVLVGALEIATGVRPVPLVLRWVGLAWGELRGLAQAGRRGWVQGKGSARERRRWWTVEGICARALRDGGMPSGMWDNLWELDAERATALSGELSERRRLEAGGYDAETSAVCGAAHRELDAWAAGGVDDEGRAWSALSGALQARGGEELPTLTLVEAVERGYGSWVGDTLWCKRAFILDAAPGTRVPLLPEHGVVLSRSGAAVSVCRRQDQPLSDDDLHWMPPGALETRDLRRRQRNAIALGCGRAVRPLARLAAYERARSGGCGHDAGLSQLLLDGVDEPVARVWSRWAWAHGRLERVGRDGRRGLVDVGQVWASGGGSPGASCGSGMTDAQRRALAQLAECTAGRGGFLREGW